ncbi:protein PIGBOS1 [Brachyhypopomus gauderio]|uniref:protein PIGBOS1 n=1 Tax=Brachyhypopomus gauderio TaxID=698409 RepID=UPI004041462D
MFSRRIPLHQVAFATLLGVGGGIYIYKPVFVTPRERTSDPPERDIRSETKGQITDEQESIKQATKSKEV